MQETKNKKSKMERNQNKQNKIKNVSFNDCLQEQRFSN
jgi:hypothetical protein